MPRVVFTFARMNPPTIGHQKVLEKMKTMPGDHVVFLSYTHDDDTNPLCWQEKQEIIESCFPDYIVPEDSNIKTPFQALEQMCKMYDDVVFVVGNDRIKAFQQSMPKYAKEWGAKRFKIVSAGARLVKSNGAQGASASKARQYATEGNYKLFRKLMPYALREDNMIDIYHKIRDRLSENKRNYT